MNDHAKVHLPHRLDIQGLRAIAVGIVVLAHADVQLFAGGFIGVDVFFVLSGFLITGLLLREYACQGRIKLIDFWVRRLRRLFPALAFMLIAVFLSATAGLDYYDVQVKTASLKFAASWSSNLYFALADFDYFSKSADRDLYLHTWSLGVEEQFYLAWPILIATTLSLVDFRARPIASKCLVLLLFLILACGSMYLVAYWADRQQLLSFYMMPARVFQFATGGAIYVGAYRLLELDRIEPMLWQRQGLAFSFTLIGLVLIFASACTISPFARYPDLVAAFPTAGAALAIIGRHHFAGIQAEDRAEQPVHGLDW